VRTTSLFDVERYESFFQLTSTVSAETDAGAAQVLSALFPCASITGAPKVRTTEIIRGLESRPRGIYTGAVGWMAPERRARLAVAIRTAIVDRREGELAYGTGGGIVWDSDPDAELREARDKARLLLEPRPEFELLETLLFEPDAGYVLLDRHLTRLADSAAYFGFPFQRADVARRLRDAADGWSECRRARLTLGRRGTLDLTSSPMDPPPGPWRVALAAAPVDTEDPFLYHKTTHRQVYETRLAGGDYDDVLLWNEAGELTESTVANLVLELDGRSWTPPLRCGLLPGTRRAELLHRGEIHERVLTPDDLRRADRIRLVNSVRGWIPVRLEEENGWDAAIAAARRGPGRPPR
jgi:para-aminobenzoate synthetase/4-amino-4-deoxychorismate lyase